MCKKINTPSFLTLMLVIGFQLFGFQNVLHATTKSIEVVSSNFITNSYQEKHIEINVAEPSEALELIAEISEENVEEEEQKVPSNTKSGIVAHINTFILEFLCSNADTTTSQLKSNIPLFLRYEAFRL